MILCDGCARQLNLVGIDLIHVDDGTQACVVRGVRRGQQFADLIAKCDFCSDPNPDRAFVRTVPSETVVIVAEEDGSTPMLSLVHDDEWGICETCRDILVTLGAGAVTQYAFDCLVKTHGDGGDPTGLMAMMVDLHEPVWDGWDGKVRTP